MLQPEVDAGALAKKLKSATAEMHHRVERSAFMARLLRGDIERSHYIALLRNLHALYAALERALLRQAEHPAVAAVLLPELFRCPAIEADLAVLTAMQRRDAAVAPLLPATLAYIERLDALGDTQPHLLVAHAYVRYLGDLNGGQALRRVVARTLALEDGAGTLFYDFGDSQSRQQLMQRFRAGLEAAQAQAADIDTIVIEAVSAFERHEQLFVQLAEAGR